MHGKQQIRSLVLSIGCIGISLVVMEVFSDKRAIANSPSVVVQFSGVVHPSCAMSVKDIENQKPDANCHLHYENREKRNSKRINHRSIQSGNSSDPSNAPQSGAPTGENGIVTIVPN